MNRKRAIISVGLGTCLAALTGGVLWLLQHQPAFYRAALLQDLPAEVRREQAKRFVQATLQLVDEVRYEPSWAQEFTEQAVNIWLADELPTQYAGWLPPEVSAPRVKFEQGGLWIAFRTHHGPWSGVVSGRVKAWVSSPNELALEIQSLSAGLIPVPVDEVIGEFVSAMNDRGWRLQWKQSATGDVLVVSLDDESSSADTRGRAVLESVELTPGRLLVSGRRRDETATRTADKPAVDSQDSDSVDDAVK
ncbi:MAG TPA: hypothetical protein VL475_06240 [Planctomycetaceae bacterium]|nr:hypothetical protein [Planctomycetaceae bacterium]